MHGYDVYESLYKNGAIHGPGSDPRAGPICPYGEHNLIFIKSFSLLYFHMNLRKTTRIVIILS